MSEKYITLIEKDEQLCAALHDAEKRTEFDFYKAENIDISALDVLLFDYKYLLKKYPETEKLSAGKVFDAKLAVYIENPSVNAGNIKEAVSGILPENSTVSELDDEAQIIELYKVIGKKIMQSFVYSNIEIPLSKVLADMEKCGIFVDKEPLQEFGKVLAEKIGVITDNIYASAGKVFNINSTKQLSEVLFEHLKLQPVGKKTKSGYSTDASALEKMRDLHPIAEEILQYRKLAKINSTYVEGLIKYIDKDNMVHTTFNMTATATGRLSSNEPNLQNIPVSNDLGGEIRKFIKAPGSRVLIDADYSQIELRVLAHIANDKTMIDAFCSNMDIHTLTASQIFSVDASEVTPEMRRKAKAVNFGIVYGISPFTLANDLNISNQEASDYIKNYLARYPSIKEYLKKTVEKAKNNGYAETLFGRRRYLPELKSKNFAVRSFGERVALNMPIQGTAADLIKLAMIKVDCELKKADLKSTLILQIHDELLLSAPEEEKDIAAEILKNAMENAVELSVPLEVSLSIGKNYYEV